MSEALVTETAASSSRGRPAKKSTKPSKPGFFARIALFIRQVIGELRKVVAPTRKELVNYTVVVLVFVIIMMAIVTGLDLAFGKAVLWIFGGSGPVEQ
ncbi:preprotein translocase subunit SecE [Paenarthrobacter sp. PH39-S1]|uniref:preprotein translocase subunit SecE n=1 Tax=Micrococcaceae TaxID=1268 RepID=UPI0024B8A422|nr:preprotein translocase subunit SecE [Paenarthrobacter sp. PH39-S1]MDJ0355900.1 preprotein translocase subunit SecE [Paenarthrobacter sp. PH39-S1]